MNDNNLTAPRAKVELRKYSSKEKAKSNTWFFKTGPGQYGEGDKFIGLTVPNIRKVAKKFQAISLSENNKLIHSDYHEERLLGLIILVGKYREAGETDKEEIYKNYMDNLAGVNNWDLVDSSAPYIVGVHLKNRDRKILYKLAKSKNMWERRVSILATASFIRDDDYEDTLKISLILLNDKEDLIHKAVGWMLREVGKRDARVEMEFLNQHHSKMPRTMLRYAIEKFSPELRAKYLKGF